MGQNKSSSSSFPPLTGSTGLAHEHLEAPMGSAWAANTPDAEGSAARQVAGVADRANDALDGTVDGAVGGAHKAVDRLADTAAPYVQGLQAGAEGLRHTKDEWSESVRSTVRANPLAALVAAVVMGVVVAKLTS